MLGSSDVQNFLGISAEALQTRILDRSLLAVPDGSDWVYPALQFSDTGVWPLLPKVLSATADMDAWSVIDQLLAPDPKSEGASLLELIKAGDVIAVDRIIEQLAGDGFS